jgi:hypothetical protein
LHLRLMQEASLSGGVSPSGILPRSRTTAQGSQLSGHFSGLGSPEATITPCIFREFCQTFSVLLKVA